MFGLCTSAIRCLIPCIGALGFSLVTETAEAQTKSVRYSSMADWNLKAENLKPTGINPYYQPLIPGHRYVMENPNFDDAGVKGHYRRTVEILHETKTFDVPAIGGTFECAVAEEKEFLDDKQFAQSEDYYCFDRTTGSVYTAGETAWEGSGGKRSTNFDVADQVPETWIVGEPDENGETEMGLIFPGTWMLGARWITDGAEGEAFVGVEAVESGLTMSTPAGTFENCVRTREYDLLDAADVNDKVWCYGVGLVSDTSGGLLSKTSHLDGKLPDPTPYHAYHKNKREMPSQAGKDPENVISKEEASKIGLATVPGQVTDIAIENKMGGKRYVVEIIAAADGVETDVVIEMDTGKVLATER
jgi:Peptidase propeptide and YPEB domain